jgi:hypothetical protein
MADNHIGSVLVSAHDPRNGNTGVDRTTFIASKG